VRSDRIRIAFCLLTGILLLAACGRVGMDTPSPGEIGSTSTASPTAQSPITPTPPASPTPDITQGTVRIWHSWDEAELNILVELIDQFQEQYPDVLFDVLYVPIENLRQRYETAAQEGNAPDILLGPGDWGPALFDAGYLADLSGMTDQGLLQSLNPAGLGTAQYRDSLIGLPYAVQGIVLYRNKAILPDAPGTFTELATMAKAVTQGEIFGSILERGFFYSGAHLNGLGGKLMEADGTPAFNNEIGLAWIELLRSFEQVGPVEYLSDQDLELFKQGRVGAIIDSTWNLPILEIALGKDNLAIDPWPSVQGGSLSGYVQSENIYLNQGTQGDNLEATWKFIEHLISPEAQTKLMEAGMIPARSGLKAADPFRDALILQAMSALAGGTTYPASPDMAIYQAAMDLALRSVFTSNITPAEALAMAEKFIIDAQAKPTATPAP
jgi:arabinogalactan oligomer / maltooligosaccharide transport system substrate-binding protein